MPVTRGQDLVERIVTACGLSRLSTVPTARPAPLAKGPGALLAGGMGRLALRAGYGNRGKSNPAPSALSGTSPSGEGLHARRRRASALRAVYRGVGSI
jgi:hypothetical protein